jgi:hypothetical protein
LSEKLSKGDEARRPTGWVVRLVDRQAAVGWAALLAQVPENLDRAWVAITTDPRSRDDLSRQHRLKFDLKAVKAVLDLESAEWGSIDCGRVAARPLFEGSAACADRFLGGVGCFGVFYAFGPCCQPGPWP